ncbi:MAG: XdhC family protein [Chloroflexi bacterium]|nr:XdhC family protein [Chloroflexota bacterium]MCI0856875.1 XdhC family protein [Chloroflexota bacterium]MCI0889530.1 XdhC family protein [Chloroflexota bacterium]
MQEILADLDRWQSEGNKLALATLTRVRRSAPRLPGARLLVTRDGRMAGSISGGCVEGDVIERAMQVLESGESVVTEYGISDEQGFDVGLSCGGQIDVLIEPFVATDAWQAVRDRVEAQQPAAFAIGLRPQSLLGRQMAIIDGVPVGSIDPALDEEIAAEAARRIREGTAGTITTPWQDEEAEIFIDAFAPAQRLYIVGATQVAIPLVAMARTLGFRVIVVDARSVFATNDRFPDADELLREWPDEALAKRGLDEHSHVVVLTHDPKFDLPVLEIALRSKAAYIGAMGSRKTHAGRLEHLRGQGFSEEDLDRIKSPIGLNIGGRAPEELALAILAEVVATRHGQSLHATEVGS